MQRGSKTVVGILAGGGSLPREIADVVAAQGTTPVIVGLEGEVNPRDFAGHDFTLVNWGRIGQLMHSFKQKNVTDLVIVGSVTRPDLWAIRTDFGFWRNLPSILKIIRSGGDDSVLRRVVGFFESQGFTVRGPAEVAPALVIGEGPFGRVAMAKAALRDFEVGRDIVARLAPFDIGQAVVVAGGQVLTVEGAEGTDAMLQRVASGRTQRQGGVLVKWPKPGQELRVDMPAIGPNTVAAVAAAGLDGIAVQAGATLAAQRADMLGAADANNVFIEGLRAQSIAVAKSKVADDGDVGLGVLAALDGSVVSRGVVIVRRHVLAVETGEGLAALVSRATRLRQWGKSKKRRGALVVANQSDLGQDVIEACAAAGYERIVVISDPSAASAIEPFMRAAGLTLDLRRPNA